MTGGYAPAPRLIRRVPVQSLAEKDRRPHHPFPIGFNGIEISKRSVEQLQELPRRINVSVTGRIHFVAELGSIFRSQENRRGFGVHIPKIVLPQRPADMLGKTATGGATCLVPISNFFRYHSPMSSGWLLDTVCRQKALVGWILYGCTAFSPPSSADLVVGLILMSVPFSSGWS